MLEPELDGRRQRRASDGPAEQAGDLLEVGGHGQGRRLPGVIASGAADLRDERRVEQVVVTDPAFDLGRGGVDGRQPPRLPGGVLDVEVLGEGPAELDHPEQEHEQERRH